MHRITLLLALVPLLLNPQTLQPLEALGDDPFWGDVAPVVSPDGTRIAFASSRAGALEVFSIRADGSDLVQLTDFGSTTHPSSWSPDGREILVESTIDGDREIYALTADGTSMRRLTYRPGRDSHPAWTPDGQRVVFYSDRDGAGDIYSMDRNGRDVRRLTDDPATDVSPVPSPDGTRIVFASDRGGDRDLYVMSIDGGEAVRLTTSQAWDGWPRWSPDGTRIAFTSERDGDTETYVIGADGTGLRRLTTTPGLDYQHDWMPEGRHLVIRSDDGGRAGLVLLDTHDLSRRHVTNGARSEFVQVARRDGIEVALQRLAASPGGPRYFHEREIENLSLYARSDSTALQIRVLERGAEAFPESPTLLLALGDAYLAGGFKDASVATFERAVRVSGEGALEKLRLAIAD